MGAHLDGDLADAVEQAPIIERWLAGGDAVARKLGGLADQPGGVRQRAHGYRSIVGGHAPEVVAGDDRGACAESRGAMRRDHAGGPSTEHRDIDARDARGSHHGMFRAGVPSGVVRFG